MNASRLVRFKRAYKHRMSVTRIDSLILTAPNGNGSEKKMHDSLHLPDSLPLWMRVREHLKKGWDPVTVNNHIDSITMPKWVASAILVAVLGFGVSSWWRSSDQRDMLIELRTELRLAKEREAEKMGELKSQADLNKVYIDNMTSQLNVIKGMLSQQQLSAVGQAGKGN